MRRLAHSLSVLGPAFLLLAAILAQSCATARSSLPEAERASQAEARQAAAVAAASGPLPSSYPGLGQSRGALIAATQLGVERVDSFVATLDPLLMSSRMNVEPMKKEGFFTELARIRPSLKPVRQLRISYWTADASGRPIRNSGLLALPASRRGQALETPLVLLCHGTQLLREKVPSRLAGGERSFALLAAASGYAVALPDYPGMGDGEGFHTYCHAVSLARSSVDLLRAARAWIASGESQGAYAEGSSLHVAGYSEGGYAAMAALRELQTEASGEFRIAAAYPMAGPFDMSGAMRLRMLDPAPSTSPSNLAYLAMGWFGIYGADFRPDAIFTRDIAEKVLPMVDGRSSSGEVGARIAEVMGIRKGGVPTPSMMSAPFRAALSDPAASAWASRILDLLRQNDLYDWPASPSIPIVLMAVPADEVVPSANSRTALAALSARGAPVSLVELSQKNHETGAYEAYGRFLLNLWRAKSK